MVSDAEAPRFEYDEKQQVQRLCVDEKWHVPIQVIGHPQPNIKWSRNDKTLKVEIQTILASVVLESYFHLFSCIIMIYLPCKMQVKPVTFLTLIFFTCHYVQLRINMKI